MKKSDIPFYNDPEDFMNGDNKFPCDTEYMVYNPMLHRYYLTPKGLLKYGVDVERRYISTSQNKIQEFIDKVSKKIYDYIQYKAGRKCYQIQMYRIATSPISIYPDQYFMRKQFEEVLAEEARFLIENSDSAKYSRQTMENAANNIPPEETYRDISDIAPEAIRILETLGLTRWFKVSEFVRLNKEEY